MTWADHAGDMARSVATRRLLTAVSTDRTLADILPKVGTWWTRTSQLTSGVVFGLDGDSEHVDERLVVFADDPYAPLVDAVYRLGARKSGRALAAWARSIAAEIGVPT